MAELPGYKHRRRKISTGMFQKAFGSTWACIHTLKNWDVGFNIVEQ